MRKLPRIEWIFVLLFPFFFMCAFLQGAYPQENIKQEYEKLKKEYQRVSADRDNILAQSKGLLEIKAKYAQIESTLKSNQEEKERLQNEFAVAKEEAAQARKNLQDSGLTAQQKINELESDNARLSEERDSLKESIRRLELEYKGLPETRKELGNLRQDNKGLQKKYDSMEQQLMKMKDQQLDKDAQIDVYRKQVGEFKTRYEQSLAKNRALEKRAEKIPGRFAEMARQNKVLIKETALMHYNLGVFYTKNKEYARAIAEFEKSIELNPGDPYAHYNLGFIYAEYSVNRAKAIEQFRKYLSLTKKEDKDTDWVRKYVLTWQSYEGKKPMD